MARKSKKKARDLEIETTRHKDKRKNIPTEELRDFMATGESKKDKTAKVTTARTLWVPAVNNHGGFGRWAFVEIEDPWNAGTAIRNFLGGQA
jgi:hypothetical protein